MRIFIFLFLLVAFSAVKAQTPLFKAAWIEVKQVHPDSLEIELVALAEKGQIVPTAQSISAFIPTLTGSYQLLNSFQVMRKSLIDTTNYQVARYVAKIHESATALRFTWNSCCRGAVLNAPQATNESLLAYTDVFVGDPGFSFHSPSLSFWPKLNYERLQPTTESIVWSSVVPMTTVLSIDSAWAGITNGTLRSLTGFNMPTSQQLQLSTSEITLLVPQAGQLAFNLRIDSRNGNNELQSSMSVAFQASIVDAVSVKDVWQHAIGDYEVFDLLGRLIYTGAHKPSLLPGTYLIKQGTRISKIQVQ